MTGASTLDKLAWLGVALAISACSASPVAPPPPKPSVVVVSPKEEAAPLKPANLGIATKLGPSVAGGRLALLQGRRVLLKEDGTAEYEHVTGPWLLKDLLSVPTTKGQRVVGIDGNGGLVTFEKPLGEGKVLAVPPCENQRLGVLPGTVVATCEDSLLTFLVPVDPAEPAARLPVEPPEPPAAFPYGLMATTPLLTAASTSTREAVAIVEVMGLMVTSDGGATWRAPRPEGAPGDVYAATALRVDESGLHAVNEKDHTEASVEVVKGTLGRFGAPAPNAAEEALWKRLEDLAREEAPPDARPHEALLAQWEPLGKAAKSLFTNCYAGSGLAKPLPPHPGEQNNEQCSLDAASAGGWAAFMSIYASYGEVDSNPDSGKTALEWYNAMELGAKVRKWSGALPAPVGKTAKPGAVHVDEVFVHDSRAVFRLCEQSQVWLARVNRHGDVETASTDLRRNSFTRRFVSLGAGENDPVAWVDEHDRLYVWRTGEAPRAIAILPPSRYGVYVGAPTQGGVPLLVAPAMSWLWTSDPWRQRAWALVRVVPIPDPPAAAANAPAPPVLDPAGWKMVHGYSPVTMPTCGKEQGGSKFSAVTKNLDGRIVYGRLSGSAKEFAAELRASEEGMCVESIFTTAEGWPGNSDESGYGRIFARADLVGNHAEIGVMAPGSMQEAVRPGSCSRY